MSLKSSLKALLGEPLLGALDYYRHPAMRASWGGPFNGQSFRQQIFRELVAKLPFGAIVETGTYRGTTTEFLHETSRLPVYTIEVDARLYGFSKARFLLTSRITVVHGDSRTFLDGLDSRTFGEKPVFFYLDAHCDTGALPLKEETRIILQAVPKAVIMIDDFRVPGDNGYAYDNYGEGNILELSYLGDTLGALNLAVFFPAQGSAQETGAKRGCVVLAKDSDLIGRLSDVKTLTRYPTTG